MTVSFAYNSGDGSFQFDSAADTFHIGCGCCAPGCTCTSAENALMFADCTPCSLRVTFTGFSIPECQHVDSGSTRYCDSVSGLNEFWMHLDAPADGSYCLAVNTVGSPTVKGYTIDPATVNVGYFSDSSCTTTATCSLIPIAFPAQALPNVSFSFTPATGSTPDQTTITITAGGVGSAQFSGSTTIDHALTAADFPITLANDAGDGSVDISIDCCGTCDACPNDSIADESSHLRLCCSHFSISIAGLTTDFTHGWDVYVHYDAVPVLSAATIIDGWQSATQQAHVYCSAGKWYLRITDTCNELGGGATKYIEFQSDIRECPSLRAADWTVIHNDFAGTPVLSILAFPGCTGQCPGACNECCATYHATLAGTGCSALNTTFDLARNGTACSWQYLAAPATSIFCDSVNNRWVARFYSTIATCGVDGYIEFTAPLYDDAGGDQKRCPLTDGTKWSCSANSYGDLTATISFTTEDCGCATPDCSTCCDGYSFEVSGESAAYGRSTLDTAVGADPSPCEWWRFDEDSSYDKSLGRLYRDTDGYWHVDDTALGGWTGVTNSNTSPCPPTDPADWTFTGATVLSIGTSGCA